MCQATSGAFPSNLNSICCACCGEMLRTSPDINNFCSGTPFAPSIDDSNAPPDRLIRGFGVQRVQPILGSSHLREIVHGLHVGACCPVAWHDCSVMAIKDFSNPQDPQVFLHGFPAFQLWIKARVRWSSWDMLGGLQPKALKGAVEPSWSSSV